MKKLFSLFFAISFTLSACGTASTQIAPPTQTGTPTVTPTATQTPTSTVTPLPAIPTFTPTFDVSTIVTVTPAEKAVCPTPYSTINVNDYFREELEYPSPDVTYKILEFLNKGGSGETLAKKLDEIYMKSDYRGGYAFRDVTGDQVPEFLFVEINYEGKPIVFSCQNGSLERLFVLSGDYDFLDYTFEIDDLVNDGIPEIIVTGTGGVSFPQSKVFIYEWSGQIFEILGTLDILALRKTEIKDSDRNGSKEIIFIGDNPSCPSCSNFLPQRERTITYGWNGKVFAEISNGFSSPKYRFQAVQDADFYTTEEKIDEALNLYSEVIVNKDLEWWSNKRFRYEQNASSMSIPGYTPLPEPIEDPAEYSSLAAYAYYRIILLHLVQGQEAEAASTYQTLQDTFGTDPYAAPYIEMATAFWEAYQSTQKMYDGCAAAIQYAVEHPQILTPLGSDYHGWQSHIYVPADVCPFR
ncbi:MAG: hypothetical protein IH588_04825 [Anaerolineales bacterium]|nr:hypothetical protein [Anaerolineales bacterium]